MLLFVLKHASEVIKVKSTIDDTPSPWLLIYLGYLPWKFAVAICRSYLPWEFVAAICRGNLPHLFAVGICGYLPQLFAVAICRGNLPGYLPWEFTLANCHENLPQLIAVRICCDYLPWVFVYVSKSFLVYVSKSCLYGSKPFLDVSKSFLFVKCPLLMVLLFVVVMAVMGHRIIFLSNNMTQNNETDFAKFFCEKHFLIYCEIYFPR